MWLVKHQSFLWIVTGFCVPLFLSLTPFQDLDLYSVYCMISRKDTLHCIQKKRLHSVNNFLVNIPKFRNIFLKCDLLIFTP